MSLFRNPTTEAPPDDSVVGLNARLKKARQKYDTLDAAASDALRDIQKLEKKLSDTIDKLSEARS